MGKVKLTLTVDADVVKKARDLGLNLSKVCENALNDYIKRLEAPKYRYVSESSSSSNEQR
jgi:post-segregation antitoxin (ccd killing protein)